MGHPTCIIEGLACWLTLCILEKIICNSTNSVQISFIETLKLIVFSWTIWWCYWQNVLMINEKNNFLTVSWLSGLLSAEIFISTGEWGVQMPPITSENSYFLRSGPQGATLVMSKVCQLGDCADRLAHARHASLQPVLLSSSLSMLSGEIYLRLKPYLVVKISHDIVTKHCCQVCVLSMMFCRSDCRQCADMVSDCAIRETHRRTMWFDLTPAGQRGM